MTTGEFTEHLR